MKKVLLYTALVLCGVVSLSMGLLSGPEAVMLMVSTAFMTVILITVLAVMDHTYVWYVPCLVFVIIAHGVYVFSSTRLATPLIYLLAVFYFIVAFCLYLAWRQEVPPRTMFALSLIMKLFFIPEYILNWLIFQASGTSSFILFSLILMLLSSAYAWIALTASGKEGIVQHRQKVLIAVAEAVPVLDILASFYGWISCIRARRKPEAVRKTHLYQKGAFASHRKRGKAVRPDFTRKSDTPDSDPNA